MNKSDSNLAGLVKTNWMRNIPWRLHAIVSIVGLLIILIMSYGFYLGNYTAERNMPLIDATMEIKLEVTTAHLWVEEVITGDRFNDFNEIKKHLYNAQWYAESMLNGGANAEGRFIPLTNPFLRKEVDKVLKGIDDFRKITDQRLETASKPHNSLLIRRFDKVYGALIDQTDKVEIALQTEIKENIRLLKLIQIVLTIICFLSIMMIMWVFHRFDQRRRHDLQIINITNENLLKALDEVKVLQGIIPICGYCKKIRDEKGLWKQLEAYINSHSEAEFSHGMCPDCYDKQMAELNNDA